MFLGTALSLFPIWVVAIQTPFGEKKIVQLCIYKICPVLCFLFLEVKGQRAACKTSYSIKLDGISRQETYSYSIAKCPLSTFQGALCLGYCAGGAVTMSCLRYDEQGGIIRTKFYGLYTVRL